MGLVVGVLSMIVALARAAAVTRLRRIVPYVSRIGRIHHTLPDAQAPG
jgi:hypothetical protein